MSTLNAINLKNPSSASNNIVLDVAGTVSVGTTIYVPSINDGPISGTRNRIINGAMVINQRNGVGVSTTFTAGGALQYCADRWYGYCTGANVTGLTTVTVGVSTGGLYAYRFSGAASVTGIGFGQRIESANSADLAGGSATLSVDLANSVLTGVGWTVYYANGVDTFGTLASPNRTQISSGTFTVGTTTSRYSATMSIPAAATTGLEVVFTVGAQTSGTWTIGNVQLEPGTVATPFERRSYGQELMLCQRYYEIVGPTHQRGYPSSTNWLFNTTIFYQVTKRSTPIVTLAGAIVQQNNISGSSEKTLDIGTTTLRWEFGTTAANTDTYILGRTFKLDSEI